MMNQKINILPAPTWNRTGVNWAGEAAALPTTAAFGRNGAKLCLSGVSEGVTVLSDTLPTPCAGIESGMGAAVDQFVLNNANAACFLTVEGAAAQPVVLDYTLDDACPELAAHLGIYAKSGSSVTVVEVCRGDAAGGACASLAQIYAEKDAKVRLIQLQFLGNACRRWCAVGARAEAGATVELVRSELGGALTACGSRTLLEGRGSSYLLDAVYYGDGNRVLDFNDTAVHTGAETMSELHTAGILDDESQKIFRGTIDFRRGSARAVGHESEDVLLLSPTARNRTTPLILCGEEKVEGQHAATVGRLDEGQLYYMASRGLSPAQAQRLLVEARFAPVLDKIPLENLRAEIMDYVGRRLDAHANAESVV